MGLYCQNKFEESANYVPKSALHSVHSDPSLILNQRCNSTFLIEFCLQNVCNTYTQLNNRLFILM